MDPALRDGERADGERQVEVALGVARTADAVLRFYWTPGREGEDRASGLVLVRDLPADQLPRTIPGGEVGSR